MFQLVDIHKLSDFKAVIHIITLFLFFSRFYVLIFRQKVREKERKRNINVWLPLMCPPLGIWPATQACALTGNLTGNPLVCRPVLNPLSHTSQGRNKFLQMV